MPIGPNGPFTGIFKSTDGGGVLEGSRYRSPGEHADHLVCSRSGNSVHDLHFHASVRSPCRRGRASAKSRSQKHGRRRELDRNRQRFSGLGLYESPGNRSVDSVYVVRCFPFVQRTSGPAVFKSMDGGQSWAALDGVPSDTTVNSLVIDPKTPSTIYALAERFSASGLSWTLLKSGDSGQTWNSYDVALPANSYLSSLAIDPVTPSRIYAAMGAAVPNGSPAGGVLKSTDGGQSWNASSDGLSKLDVRTLALNAVDQNTIYGGGFGGVFQSVDGGAHWNGTGLSAYTGSLLVDVLNANVIYAQTGTSFGCNSDRRLILKTTDAGANWTDSASPNNTGCILNVSFPSVHAAPMMIDPTNPSVLYLAESESQSGYTALLKSTDGGIDWIAAWDWFQGLRGSVKALAIDPAHSSTL